MLLQQGVGKTFRAVRAMKGIKNKFELDTITKLKTENLSLTERLRSSEAKASLFEQRAKDAQSEIQTQKAIIEEAEITIEEQKKQTLSWIALSEWYQTRSIHCSDMLGQMMMYLQGTTPNLSEWHLSQE
ncbi:hypothetical protein N7454_003233 [Penicillium verhagenii]|nr:hypothetical protein N7454_003233 [Penicillium verhagenii]